MDFILVRIGAEPDQLFGNARIASDQHRNAIAILFELNGGAQHDVFFGFGKNDALWLCPCGCINLGQNGCRRVLTRAQACAISVHIGNRLLRDARIHRCFCHGRGDDFHEARVERRRDNIITAEFVHYAAISSRHFFGHGFTRQLCQGMRCRNLHGFVDRRGAHVERPAEQEGEAQDIVDLIWKIRPSRRNDRIGPRRARHRWRDFGIGVRHGKNDWLRRHRLHHIGAQRIGGGKAKENICADDGLCQIARGCFCRMRRFPLVHAFRTALINHAGTVAHNDIVVRYAHGFDQLGAGNRRCACAIADNLYVFQRTARKLARIDQSCRRDDGGAVLVIMKNRNVHPFFQRLFNDEAIRRGDIFQIDAAKGRFKKFDRINETLRIFGLHLDIDRVDVGEAFEQHRFAFHHGLGCQCTQIAHAKDRCTI